MRYDTEKGRILISLKEFVTVARRGIAQSLPYDDEEPEVCEADRIARSRLGIGERKRLSLVYREQDIDYELYGDADEISEDGVTVARVTDGRPRKSDIQEVRGEAFILGYMLSMERHLDPVRIKTVFINTITGEPEIKEEQVQKKKLLTFFEKCKISVGLYGKPEVDRVTVRLASMRGARFPYGKMREGQDSFIQEVYRTITRGGRLYATAPTGTGKTVSVMYPAIRAMGEGRCDKIFYLTPKTTTQEVARECIEETSKQGVIIRAIILTSKERSCKNNLTCRDDRRLCENSKSKKLADAVMAIYKLNRTVITVSDIHRIAPEYGVCPYELELSYSELCDVIVCDINYLFDPNVYIRRFFTDGGSYAFLIDEAHNLSDRARDMYSFEMSLSDLTALGASPLIGEHSDLRTMLPEYKNQLEELLLPYLKEEIREVKDGERLGAMHLSEPPTRMYELFGSLLEYFEREMFAEGSDMTDERKGRRALIKDFYYKIKRANNTLQIFDSKFKLILFYNNGDIKIKLFCLDTGGVIADKLDKGRSAVLFSATLTPLDYYKAILGGDGTSRCLEVASPFVPEQLSVCIMDKISTRYSERERTIPAVCQAIAAMMIPKRGNYMVFSPSFEYSDALCEAFKRKYPKLRVLSQRADMSTAEKAAFLREFEVHSDKYLVGFCVMGGIYSEGVDLVGDSLIGAAVVGIGMPALSYEREAMAEYFEERYECGKQYAYIYPGMNKVFQAAGRVIRRESDRGVIVLIDDRFDDPIYKKSIPSLWRGMRYIDSPSALKENIERFWRECDPGTDL